MKCIILSAGFATRLYPLTKDRPKSLIVINNKPMIEHITDKIEELKEVDEIYLVTNEKFKELFKAWLKSDKIKIVSNGVDSEEDMLGAIGDLNFVIKNENINDDVLVIAGDNLFDFDLNNFLSKFKGNPLVGLYDVKNIDLARNYGVVELKDGIITDFTEKPLKPKSTLISTACYSLPRSSLKLVEEFVKESDADRLGDFIKFLVGKLEVNGLIFQGKWFDIGNFESLEKARREFK